MNPISVLFYLEPVCFRNDPLFFLHCVELISEIMHAQHGNDMVFGFASSTFLCKSLRERADDIPHYQFIINPKDILEPFEFNRHAYARNLYAREDCKETNISLVRIFREIDRKYAPDVVVTFSQNIYLETLFGHRRTLFIEMAPLPRYNCGLSVFIDPLGQRLTSILNTQAKRIRELPINQKETNDLLGLWNQIIKIPATEHPTSKKFKSWLDETRCGRSVILFAMQPPDFPTYEAAYEVLPHDAVMMRWLDDLPSSWMAIATYHHQYLPAGIQATESMLAELFPAFTVMPEELAISSTTASEFLLPHIDAVVTISSAVAMTGLLYGKSAVTYGQSYLSNWCENNLRHLSKTTNLTENERASLLMFLTNTYCHAWSDVLSGPGYFTGFVRRMLESPDPIEPFFDLSTWSFSHAKKILTGQEEP